MTIKFHNKLAIDKKRLDEINSYLLDPNNKIISDLIEVVEKYGGPEKINQKARKAGLLYLSLPLPFSTKVMLYYLSPPFKMDTNKTPAKQNKTKQSKRGDNAHEVVVKKTMSPLRRQPLSRG